MLTEPVLTEPVLGVPTPQQSTESMSAPIAEPISPAAPLAQDLQQPVLESASYSAAHSASVTQEATQGTKTDGSFRSYPPLFDTSLLLSRQLAALAAAADTAAAAALKGFPGGMPNPLFPLGFPFGAPLPGTTFSSSSGIALSLELLAILAVLYALSRRDISSVSPREVFRLVSSPRLVTELPG
jgi:hypothetical protein